jgi:hypothetical protein
LTFGPSGAIDALKDPASEAYCTYCTELLKLGVTIFPETFLLTPSFFNE